MAKTISLKAQSRTHMGTTGANRLRKQGIVPAVIYGKKTNPVSVQLNDREVRTALKHVSGENVLVDLQLDLNGRTESHFALLQEVQHDTLSGQILHLDLHEIAQDELIRIDIPVEAVGEAAGVRTAGGLLEHTMHTLHVECLPKDMPEVISVDVSSLEIGQSIHVSDIVVPAGVTVLSQKTLTAFACVAPKAVEETAPGAAAAAATGEVEVIKEKKAEGDAAKAGDKKAPEAKGGEKKEAAKK
ncbi:MAG: 50S ribosomal protein L25/general stress protein Ctc [Verrucomicrobiae bacterium]|nr:50S ribosomal protein L25/general stress protein Ctc [Verrucomicrobiae bacterium]